jgi:hypothetical protein
MVLSRLFIWIMGQVGPTVLVGTVWGQDEKGIGRGAGKW